jgi:hypothetical protein
VLQVDGLLNKCLGTAFRFSTKNVHDPPQRGVCIISALVTEGAAIARYLIVFWGRRASLVADSKSQSLATNQSQARWNAVTHVRSSPRSILSFPRAINLRVDKLIETPRKRKANRFYQDKILKRWFNKLLLCCLNVVAPPASALVSWLGSTCSPLSSCSSLSLLLAN